MLKCAVSEQEGGNTLLKKRLGPKSDDSGVNILVSVIMRKLCIFPTNVGRGVRNQKNIKKKILSRSKME